MLASRTASDLAAIAHAVIGTALVDSGATPPCKNGSTASSGNRIGINHKGHKGHKEERTKEKSK
jgi:hypothetical protein